MPDISDIYKPLSDGGSLYYGWSSVMHTRIDIVLCGQPQADCRACAERILAELSRLETRFNRFDPDSDISVINRLGAQQYVDTDAEMLDVLDSAVRYGGLTNYFFDVTVHSRTRSSEPRGRIVVDRKRSAVTFGAKGVVVDLGGFLKGYGLEVVRGWLLTDGWCDFMINFGNSSVCAQGRFAGNGAGWKVGVENYNIPGRNVLELNISGRSLNTSGNTASHTRHIYSRSLGGFCDNLGSVSVVTGLPLDGEVLSTAVFAAGERYVDFVGNFRNYGIYRVRYDGGFASVEVL